MIDPTKGRERRRRAPRNIVRKLKHVAKGTIVTVAVAMRGIQALSGAFRSVFDGRASSLSHLRPGPLRVLRSETMGIGLLSVSLPESTL